MIHRKPGTIIEETIRTELLRNHFRRSHYDLLLDLGCGIRPYQKLYEPFCTKTLGADMPGEYFEKRKVDILCTVNDIPLEDESVDAVLLAEVLHDIKEPTVMFNEIKRILQPNGTLIMTSPFMVPICDNQYDHYRYTKHGIEYHLRKNGFEIINISSVSDLFGAIIQFCVKPQLKLWNFVSKKMGIKFIYSWMNPLMLLGVYSPQYLYMIFYYMQKKMNFLSKIQKKFDYGCIGYVTIAKRI